MAERYAILAVEGPTDQAFVSKILKKFLGFKEFNGDENKLEPFWKQFIPTYPPKKNLYVRLDMPSILYTNELSVAVYAAEGNNLKEQFPVRFKNHRAYCEDICAFGIIADADKKPPADAAQEYCTVYQKYFPKISSIPGEVIKDKISTGIYVLPNNRDTGVLEKIILECGDMVYKKHITEARNYLDKFDKDEKKHWKPFDKEKAVLSTVASILKPGKTNTVTIKDNKWLCNDTLPVIQEFVDFIKKLLAL